MGNIRPFTVNWTQRKTGRNSTIDDYINCRTCRKFHRRPGTNMGRYSKSARRTIQQKRQKQRSKQTKIAKYKYRWLRVGRETCAHFKTPLQMVRSIPSAGHSHAIRILLQANFNQKHASTKRPHYQNSPLRRSNPECDGDNSSVSRSRLSWKWSARISRTQEK